MKINVKTSTTTIFIIFLVEKQHLTISIIFQEENQYIS